jgi:hypothetical protein
MKITKLVMIAALMGGAHVANACPGNTIDGNSIGNGKPQVAAKSTATAVLDQQGTTAPSTNGTVAPGVQSEDT